MYGNRDFMKTLFSRCTDYLMHHLPIPSDVYFSDFTHPVPFGPFPKFRRQKQMEKLQQQWWRAVKSRLSYKNATIAVCLFNIITALLFLQGFFYSSSKLATSHKALYWHVKESDDIRRAMVPLDLLKRVREIRHDINVGTEQIQQKDVKQTAAVDLISRLNNFHSNSDSGSNKALEEWRKRKMERARQRSLVKNGTASSQT